MEGQLRPGLRADDDDDEEEEAAAVVIALVLLLTVVLAEDVAEEEEDGVVAGADGACTSLADESTLSCIFSTLTAGVRILSCWIILKPAKGGLGR